MLNGILRRANGEYLSTVGGDGRLAPNVSPGGPRQADGAGKARFYWAQPYGPWQGWSAVSLWMERAAP